MKALKIFEKFNEKTNPIEDMGIGVGALDIYTEVWTIIGKRSSEISKIYLKKEYATRACEERNKEIRDYYRKSRSNLSDNDINRYYANYSVVSLADAIEMISEVVIDNALNPGEDY